MVTSQKMIESEIGYRGSKSILLLMLIVFYLIIIYFLLPSASIDQIFILTAISPVMVYLNAEQDKAKILKDNYSKAGVYRWLHRESGKSYIGSSVNLTNRFYTYFNLKVMLNSITISIIARALLKHGYSSFQLEIIEYCDPANCIEREQFYLDLLKPEYNILKKAGSKLGSKHSEATIKRISESLVGNKRAVGGKRVMTPIEVLDLETGKKTVYPSISDTAKALGALSSSIRSYFSRNIRSPFKGRYVLIKVID